MSKALKTNEWASMKEILGSKSKLSQSCSSWSQQYPRVTCPLPPPPPFPIFSIQDNTHSWRSSSNAMPAKLQSMINQPAALCFLAMLTGYSSFATFYENIFIKNIEKLSCPGTVLDARHRELDKIEKVSVLLEPIFQWEKIDNKYINKQIEFLSFKDDKTG